MIIEKLIKKLDAEILKIHAEYVKLHDEFDVYRGKKLEKEEDWDKVNTLLKELQDKFHEMHPALHFVATRYQFTTNTVNSYNEFIQALIKAGAKQDERTPIKSTKSKT